MDTIENITTDDADAQAVIEHAMTGKPLDPEAARRIREKAERVTEEIYQKYGLLDIGTQLIREARGPLDEAQERELTLAQRDLLRDSEGPPQLLNPDTGETYVLLSEQEYERLRRSDR